MEPVPRKLPGADGLTLSALEWSDDGVSLLFLHGFGNDAHVWDDAAPAVAAHYATRALDLRGHGESDRDPEARYDHASMAADLEAVADALEIRRTVIVAHSLGARVAMHFAGRHPDWMAGFVIVDSGPDLDLRGVSRIRMEARDGPSAFSSPAEFERVLASQYPATPAPTLARLARHWLKQRPDGRFELKVDPALRRRAEGADPEALRRASQEESERLWDALARISCPTLLIRGAASDVLDPETADRMVDEVLPDGRLVVIPRAGHSVMLDNPGEFEEALTAFVLG